MTRATLLQLAFGAVVLLGLATAAIWRAPGPPSSAVPPSPAPEAADPLPASAAALAPAAPATTPAATAPATLTPSASLDESSLMSELRRARSSDPERAVRLAEEGNRRFPDSPDAPERSAILIHALAEEGQRTEARRSAEEMVNHYPDSSWVRDVELFTGAHRHRNIRINDEGGVEYY